MLARLSVILTLMLATAAAWWVWPVRPRVSWEKPADTCCGLHFAANGSAVVLAYGDCLIYCDVVRGTRTPIVTHGAGGVVQISADGQTVAFDGSNGVCLWHPVGAATNLGGGQLGAIAGDRIVVEAQRGDTLEFRMHDSAGRLLQAQVFADFCRLRTLALADGRVLAVLHRPRRQVLQVVELLNRHTWLDLASFEPGFPQEFDTRLAAVLAPDGQMLAVLTSAGITVYRLPTGKVVCVIPPAANEHYIPCRFNADGSVLATYRWRGPDEPLASRLWRIVPDRAAVLQDLVEMPEFSANGQHYLTRRPEPPVGVQPALLVLHDLEPARRLPLNVTTERDGGFAPDNRTLTARVSVPPSRFQSWLGRSPWREGIQLLDVATGQPLPWFREGTKAHYFPDGRALAIVNGTRLEVWDVEPWRGWWIEVGLPVAFVALAVVGCGMIWRRWRCEAGLSHATVIVAHSGVLKGQETTGDHLAPPPNSCHKHHADQ